MLTESAIAWNLRFLEFFSQQNSSFCFYNKGWFTNYKKSSQPNNFKTMLPWKKFLPWYKKTLLNNIKLFFEPNLGAVSNVKFHPSKTASVAEISAQDFLNKKYRPSKCLPSVMLIFIYFLDKWVIQSILHELIQLNYYSIVFQKNTKKIPCICLLVSKSEEISKFFLLSIIFFIVLLLLDTPILRPSVYLVIATFVKETSWPFAIKISVKELDNLVSASVEPNSSFCPFNSQYAYVS